MNPENAYFQSNETISALKKNELGGWAFGYEEMPRGGTAPARQDNSWQGIGPSYNIYDSIKIYGASAANHNINAYNLMHPKPRKKAPLNLGESYGKTEMDKQHRNSIFKAYGVKKRGPIKATNKVMELQPQNDSLSSEGFSGVPYKLTRTSNNSVKRSAFKTAVLDAEHSVLKKQEDEEDGKSTFLKRVTTAGRTESMKRNTFHSVGQHPSTACDNPYATTTRPVRNKKKNRPMKQLAYPAAKGPQPLPPSQMMLLDGIYNNTELKRPPSRGGEFAEKTREEVMLEKKREVKMAQQDALHAMRNKKSGQRPPCRQKEPNALLEIDELFSFKAGGYMEEELPDQIHNFNQIHGHRGAEPQFNFHHHKKNNTQDVANLVTLPISYGERPPSRHKTPPKALGLDLPVFGEQHEELASGKSSVVSHTAGHSKVGSFYSPSEETSEIIQLHGNGAILFSDSSHVEESGAVEQNDDFLESGGWRGQSVERNGELQQIRSQTLDASERRGALNKSLNNTTTGLKPLGGASGQKEEIDRSKLVMNSTDKLEKEVPSPLSKLGQLKQRPSKRLQSANERPTGLFRDHENFKVKRDNFLRGAGGGSNKLSPSEKAKPLPLKPLIGLQEDSPPFPSSSQLEKYKRAVLASPNERQGTTFTHGFSLTSAASAGKGNFRKGNNAKSGELFKIIRQKHNPLQERKTDLRNGKEGGANNSAVVKGSQNGLKFESNLESDFLNLFHQD